MANENLLLMKGGVTVRVVGAGGNYVGYVKHIDGEHLVVGRPAASDLYVPLLAGHMASTDRFVLDVSAPDVAHMRWEAPGTGTYPPYPLP